MKVENLIKKICQELRLSVHVEVVSESFFRYVKPKGIISRLKSAGSSKEYLAACIFAAAKHLGEKINIDELSITMGVSSLKIESCLNDVLKKLGFRDKEKFFG